MKTLIFKAYGSPKNLEKLLPLLADYQLNEKKELISAVVKEGTEVLPEGTFENCTALTSVILPEGLKEIGNSAFLNCIALSSITLPQGLQKIDRAAFRNCSALKAIKLPSTLLEIGDGAFSHCIALEKLLIPQGVQRLGFRMVSSCYNLKELTLPANVEKLYNIFGSNYNLRKLSLPYVTDSWKVFKFFCYAMYALEEITFPVQIEAEQISQFSNKYHPCLKTIKVQNASYQVASEYVPGYLPDAVKELLSEQVLDEQGNLIKAVVKAGVTELPENAFKDCYFLQEIKLPESLHSIGKNAFAFCHSLKNITLPQELTTLAPNSFLACTALEEITLPSSLKTLEKGTFAECVRLRHINIPEGLEEVEEKVFSTCSALEEITFPASVVKINDAAFASRTTPIKVNFLNPDSAPEKFYNSVSGTPQRDWEESLAHIHKTVKETKKFWAELKSKNLDK